MFQHDSFTRERSRFCTRFIERCSVKTILLSSLVSSAETLNLSSKLQIYFALMEVPERRRKAAAFLFGLLLLAYIFEITDLF